MSWLATGRNSWQRSWHNWLEIPQSYSYWIIRTRSQMLRSLLASTAAVANWERQIRQGLYHPDKNSAFAAQFLVHFFLQSLHNCDEKFPCTTLMKGVFHFKHINFEWIWILPLQSSSLKANIIIDYAMKETVRLSVYFGCPWQVLLSTWAVVRVYFVLKNLPRAFITLNIAHAGPFFLNWIISQLS